MAARILSIPFLAAVMLVPGIVFANEPLDVLPETVPTLGEGAQDGGMVLPSMDGYDRDKEYHENSTKYNDNSTKYHEKSHNSTKSCPRSK